MSVRVSHIAKANHSTDDNPSILFLHAYLLHSCHLALSSAHTSPFPYPHLRRPGASAEAVSFDGMLRKSETLHKLWTELVERPALGRALASSVAATAPPRLTHVTTAAAANATANATANAAAKGRLGMVGSWSLGSWDLPRFS